MRFQPLLGRFATVPSQLAVAALCAAACARPDSGQSYPAPAASVARVAVRAPASQPIVVPLASATTPTTAPVRRQPRVRRPQLLHSLQASLTREPEAERADAGPEPEQPITAVMNSPARKVSTDPVVRSYLPSSTNAGAPRYGAWGEGMAIGGRK